MCGIAGFCRHPDDGKFDPAAVVWILASEMESRGKDATGILTVNQKGRIKLRKKPHRASRFLDRHYGIGETAMVALIHTRAATKGSPTVAANNHPIVHGSVIGTHNGVIRNDDELFRDNPTWVRQGEVDSEAIFAALHHGTTPHEALPELDGSWAIAWVDESDPFELWIAKGPGSPLCYAVTDGGSLIYASTHTAVDKCLDFLDGKRSYHSNIKTATTGFIASMRVGQTLQEREALPLDVLVNNAPSWESASGHNYGHRGRHYAGAATAASLTAPTVPTRPKQGDSRYMWVKTGPRTSSSIRGVLVAVEDFDDKSWMAWWDVPTSAGRERIVSMWDPENAGQQEMFQLVDQGSSGFETPAEMEARRKATVAEVEELVFSDEEPERGDPYEGREYEMLRPGDLIRLMVGPKSALPGGITGVVVRGAGDGKVEVDLDKTIIDLTDFGDWAACPPTNAEAVISGPDWEPTTTKKGA